MKGRTLAIALLIVVAAVVLQTTLFVNARARPFGGTPDLVLLAVLGTVRKLDPEPGIFLGFTGGLLVDLLGGAPMGLWALVMTVVAYLTIRLRHIAEEQFALAVVGAFVLTALGWTLFVLVATLFGEQPLRDPGAARLVLLASIYNTILAPLVLPLINLALRPPKRVRRRILA